MLPFRVRLAAILTARSALPYSATIQRQLDPDPLAGRPEPGNARCGDGFFSLDARLSKVMSPRGRRSAAIFVEIFNATNATNLLGYIGVLDATQFG